MTKRYKITLGGDIQIHEPGRSPFIKAVKSDHTFKNPELAEAYRMGRYVGDIPELLRIHQTAKGLLTLPRGYWDRLVDVAERHEVQFDLEDNRISAPVVFPELQGVTLRGYQDRCVDAAFQRCQGGLEMPTGSGKTLTGSGTGGGHRFG